MQQHDKLQVESKQQLADVKKKLLESQTEIVKLHCKLQEVWLSTCVLCTDVHNINNQKILFVFQAVTGSKTAQAEIEQLKRSSEQMHGKGMEILISRIVDRKNHFNVNY